MTFSRRIFSMTFATLFAVAALVSGQSTPAASSGNTVYVQDFEAHWGNPDGSSSSGRRGPLGILKNARSSEQATMSAGSLSGAIASEFKSQGMNSQRIARDGKPLPSSGWLVTGIFYALDTKTGMIQMPSFISGQPDPVNTQVTVSVADLAKNPNAPFIVFGTADALRGQGPPAGWNPYVVAAKFVIGKVESAADIQKLAKEIVTKILENKAEIDKAQAQAK